MPYLLRTFDIPLVFPTASCPYPSVCLCRKNKASRFIRFQMIFNLLHRATGKTFCRCPKPCPEYRNQHITPLTELAIQRLLWRTSHTGGRIFFPSQWKKHAFSLRCVMAIPLRQSLHNLCSFLRTSDGEAIITLYTLLYMTFSTSHGEKLTDFNSA